MINLIKISTPLILLLINISLVLAGKSDSLRSLAKKKNIFIGAAIMPEHLDEKEFADTLKREYNCLTAENNLKWGCIHPAKDIFTFEGADKIVNFAVENNMKIRGHTLVWHFYNWIDWLTDKNLSRAELLEILKNHIFTVVGRYKGRIRDWDVLNEIIEENGQLRQSFWYKTIGPDYIELALKFAHEADPDANLFINDYGVETINPKSDGLYKLLKELKDKGVPLNGVGFQYHLDMNFTADFYLSAAKNIQRFMDLGLKVQFTEVDVRILMEPTKADLEKQAYIYKQLMNLILAFKCDAFVMWGMTDKHSWIPSFFKGYGDALIFDKEYKPKPAYFALKKVLSKPSVTPDYFDNFEKFYSNSSFVNEWNIIGPFELGYADDTEENGGDVSKFKNAVIKSRDSKLPPEIKIDLKAEYEGKNNQKISWQKIEADDNGFVDIDKFYNGKDYAVACAVTYIYSPKKASYEMPVGSDDSIIVSINDKEVLRNHTLRAAQPDQDIFTAELKKGWNKVLLKIVELQGGWGFYFRIIDPKNSLKFSSTPN
ncbi:MAG: endo-1,4-beta-xylanase [Elusimicrobia bacterium]|nr:endo-1,4-beta-xylanase [Elusimicrobiota bacterium]